MDMSFIAPEIREYLLELLRRRAISLECLTDRMLINHLSDRKIDIDYLVRKDRHKENYKFNKGYSL